MTTMKKSIGALLMLCLLFVACAVLTAPVFAAEEITVDIVSFTRGAQEDLRSSELLEAKVTGYDGNVRALTYKWTSTIGTYLYVYNAHNMYGINNTDGEIEIYNKNVSSSANMQGRSYKDTFSGVGYAWASIYGANLSASDLVGKITVEVYDTNGKLLASDTHEGTREESGSWWRPTYTYKGFLVSNLEDDVNNVYFGLFEGDTKNVKILLGESSIVHITCVECSISNPKVVSGSETIAIVVDKETKEAHIKSISGTSNGEAKVQITIKKGNCKFHQNVSATRTVEVYVYKKPTTTSTATAIMLDDLDDRCTYYIGGVAGVRQTVNGKEYVVFEGLAPNTQYQIEVVGQANEKTDPVYAYVYETTKPAHTGTVEVILNGSYDTSTGTATGERVDIGTVMPNVETIYLRYENSEIYFPLERTDTGKYTSVLSNGNYTVYYTENGSAQKKSLGAQILTVDNESRTRELFFNSVTYHTNGGAPAIADEYYLVESTVPVNRTVPEKDGWLFTHWVDADGNTYLPGDTLTEAIGKAYTLTAQYVESYDVYVNLVIKHICKDGDNHNNDHGMHNVAFTVDRRFGGTGDFTELVSKTITWNGEGAYNQNGYVGEYINSQTAHKDRTIYTAQEPALVNVAKAAEYTVTKTKACYALESVESTLNADGDLVLTATLIFDPTEFVLNFEVELDEESKRIAEELKPVAVNAKVTVWSDSPYDDVDEVAWTTISQHHETYTRVALDENGYGAGMYSVWMATTDTQTPYSYRIEVVSYETADGTISPAFNGHGKFADRVNEVYSTENFRFNTTVTVDGGNTPNGSTLPGAYYDAASEKQVGTIKGIVNVEVFDVTFVPNGGVLNGSAENTELQYQVGIPNLSAYVPTREGGYVFDGWFYADQNGNMTETVAVSDTILREDATLIAKWRDPLTVKGHVAAEGTYYAQDRVGHAIIYLQRIDANGYAETIATETVQLEYDQEHGYGWYTFTGIPDDGHTYRVKSTAANYHTHYLNDTVQAEIHDFDLYENDVDDDLYLAQFLGDTEANVHIYMHFIPENFDLAYMVDASSIGEGLRPTNAEVLVLCDTGEHIDPQHWAVISQMIDTDGTYIGNDTVLVGGKGSGSQPVWQIKSDGATPYDYSIRLDALTFDGITFGDELPYAIYYNGSARYGEVNGQTQTLVATVVPRMYSVIFDLGAEAGENEIRGMDAYYTVDGEFKDTYYWSHGKSVTAQPSMDAYVFLGWYDADGNRVTEIPAESSGDVTLYAKWNVEARFEVLADAGYYSTARNAEEKEGIISLNARISNYAEVKDVIVRFGIYVYDTTGTEIRVTAGSVDNKTLAADGGEYHVLVVNIPQGNFESTVTAAPFVVIGDKVILGESMTTSVSAINKWLGPKDAEQ